jgi:hypothetical protein
MLGIVLMVIVLVGAFAAFQGLIQFTDGIVRRGHASLHTSGEPAPAPRPRAPSV